MIDISTVISYLKRILHTFVALSTRVSARLSVVSFLSSCAVWGTDRVGFKICENLQMSCKFERVGALVLVTEGIVNLKAVIIIKFFRSVDCS